MIIINHNNNGANVIPRFSTISAQVRMSFGDIGEKFTCAAAMRRGVIPDLSPGFLSVTFATMNSMTSICPCLTAK